MNGVIFRLDKKTAEWLAQFDLTEQERSLVVKKIWEMTFSESERIHIIETIQKNTIKVA